MKICNIPSVSESKKVLGGVMVANVSMTEAMMNAHPDVQYVTDEKQADLVVVHATELSKTRPPDIYFSHGLYPTSQKGWGKMYDASNMRMIDTMLKAKRVVTVSEWGAEIFRRDFHVSPTVIPNGVNVVKFHRNSGDPNGFILWPKITTNPVCDPTPVILLSNQMPKTKFASIIPLGGNIKTLGRMSQEDYFKALSKCSIYLTTTKENSSNGTMEAMAMGIPTVGYDWGHNHEALINGCGCDLVEPGDIPGLINSIARVKANWNYYSRTAREYAILNFDISNTIDKLYETYQEVLNEPSPVESISVVITLYNYARFVSRAIESVLGQTLRPKEIIVVDDASTDNPDRILERYAGKIKVVKLSQNVGVAEARNIGIQKAKGTIIASLDADDAYLPDYLYRALPEFKNKRAGIVYGFLALVDENHRPVNAAFFRHKMNFAGFSKRYNQIPTCCCFRKVAWARAGGYRKYMSPSEDADLWFRILSQGWEAKHLGMEIPVSYHTIQGQGLTHTMKRVEWQLHKAWAFRNSGLGYPVQNYDKPLVSFILDYDPSTELDCIKTIDHIEGLKGTKWEIICHGKPSQRMKKGFPFVRWNTTRYDSLTTYKLVAGEIIDDEKWYQIVDNLLFPEP